FLHIRRKKFIHLNSWILLVGIVGLAFAARFGKINMIDYSQLLVSDEPGDVIGKRILILDNTPDLYKSNFLATPFLDWRLSREIFSHPDYYQNVTSVYHSFKHDPPEIVLDPENLLKHFFHRMPDVESNYIRQGDRYIRKVSN
ncbi:MAG TPA: hypothetical protein VIQ51_02855, partial [Chryseosolibacter sp.]